MKSFYFAFVLAAASSSSQAVCAPTYAGQSNSSTNAVPSYVKTYAPYIYLQSSEIYNPSDLATHVANTIPYINFTATNYADNLSNLGVDAVNNDDVYLTVGSDKVTSNNKPQFLYGQKPDATGKTAQMPIVVVDKGNGLVDAFYFTFYSYNGPTKVLGVAFDNHVGDWEHMMIRFMNGVPQAVWFSQHQGGQAFTYNAVQKMGLRPVGYSAQNSHALYGLVGNHDHTLPGEHHLPAGLIVDHTDAGTLWDPMLNPLFFTYSLTTSTFTATAENPAVPTSWLDFVGQWGDEQYPTSVKGQLVVFGQAAYASGPTGPRDKGLDRTEVCLGLSDCQILDTLVLKKRSVDAEW